MRDRQLSDKWLDTPHAKRLEIATRLGLLVDGDGKAGEAELAESVLDRAVLSDVVGRLRAALGLTEPPNDPVLKRFAATYLDAVSRELQDRVIRSLDETAWTKVADQVAAHAPEMREVVAQVYLLVRTRITRLAASSSPLDEISDPELGDAPGPIPFGEAPAPIPFGRGRV